MLIIQETYSLTLKGFPSKYNKFGDEGVNLGECDFRHYKQFQNHKTHFVYKNIKCEDGNWGMKGSVSNIIVRIRDTSRGRAVPSAGQAGAS
jgi:hypothetical protein